MRSPLLINEPPLQVLPTLAKAIGLNEAIILQQVHYWLDPRLNKNIFEEKHWVHNTFAQWEQQFAFWSKKTIVRTISMLEDAGLLISFITRDFKKTKYYTLNYGLLNSICPSEPRTPSENDTQSQGKITLRPNEFAEKQGNLHNGQNDHIDRNNLTTSRWTKCPHREGQFDHIDRDKMSTFHYTENTNPENTTENTPPLSPPPQILTQKTQEEEEKNQNNNFNLASQNSISDQPISPPTSITFQTTKEELTDQQSQFFQEMMKIWNHTVQDKLNPGQEVRLTDKRKALLRACLKEVFGSIVIDQKLDAWRNYCTLIAKSRFLLGHNPNGFRVTLDWALNPDNAYKILEGAIYDRPEATKNQQDTLNCEEFSSELVRSLPSSKYLTQWVKMSIIIAKFIGKQKYRHWFSRVILSDISNTTATLLVEGNLTKDIIIRQYSSELRCAVQSFYPTIRHIEFKIVSSLWSNA